MKLMEEAMGISKKEWTIGRQREQVEVPAAEEMLDSTFISHVEKRHYKDCKIEGYMSRHSVPAWIGVYRAFHERLHELETPGQHDHYHAEPEDEE